MIDQQTESMIRGLIVEGYMDGVLVAERRNVSVDDIKLLYRQILLGLFLSVNEIGIDHLPPDVRLRELEKQLQEFASNGVAIYERQMFDEANATKANSALRLADDKFVNRLTDKLLDGHISPQAKGESNET